MRLFAVSCCVLAIFCVAAFAVPITQPTSLNPGDQYRLAFVTSTIRDATSSNIDDYNAFVTATANAVPELAALLTTWKAIASTSSVDARVNTDTVPTFAGGSLGVPIFLLNDTKLVDSNDDLWDGSVDLLLSIDETGEVCLCDVFVWTGSAVDGRGSGYNSVLGNQLGFLPVSTAGTWTNVDFWVLLDNATDPSVMKRSLYGLSDPLTVPSGVVPEPSTLLLLAVGICFVCGIGIRQRKKAV